MKTVRKPSVTYLHKASGKWTTVEFNTPVAAYRYYRRLIDKGWFTPNEVKLGYGAAEYKEEVS